MVGWIKLRQDKPILPPLKEGDSQKKLLEAEAQAVFFSVAAEREAY